MTDFKINLSEKFPHLEKAPIVEAVIDIRARAETEWEEALVREKLEPKIKDYPNFLSQFEWKGEVKIQQGKPVEATTQAPDWKGFRCESNDKLQIAQFYRDRFIYSRLHPYENWDSLRKEATRLLSIYSEIASPSEIQRVGLRYINKIKIPPQEFDLKDYLQSPPESPEELDIPFTTFLHRDTFVAPSMPYVVNVVKTIPESWELILDIDVYTLDGTQLSFDTLEKNLHEMRWLKNKVFFGTMSPSALERFK